MTITKRDKEILRFVEEYGSITIEQCRKIFYKGNNQGYYSARRRLKLLSDQKYLNRFRKGIGSHVVYYLDKKISNHRLYILDVYAELINLGAEIKLFEQEYKVDKYRVDALLEVEFNGYFYPIILEIDLSSYTSYDKLEGIYKSNHFQEKYKELDNNIFPTVVIARAAEPVKPIQSNEFNIIYTDFDFNNLINIFLE
jgi:hypothetical protein